MVQEAYLLALHEQFVCGPAGILMLHVRQPRAIWTCPCWTGWLDPSSWMIMRPWSAALEPSNTSLNSRPGCQILWPGEFHVLSNSIHIGD